MKTVEMELKELILECDLGIKKEAEHLPRPYEKHLHAGMFFSAPIIPHRPQSHSK